MRVCEDIVRFVLGDAGLVESFKRLRHELREHTETVVALPVRVTGRESRGDPGRKIFSRQEFTRGSVRDILYANLQRVKESVRVLEEFSKLVDVKRAGVYKELRYRMYELEKRTIIGMQALRDRRHGE